MFILGLFTGIILAFLLLIGIPILWLKVQYIQGKMVARFASDLIEKNAEIALKVTELTNEVNAYKIELENGTGVN